MKKGIFMNKLISSIFITILLLYFMINTTSPKIIFVPFLICSVSMAGKSIALSRDKKKYAALFDKLFVGGFLLFWFGFLVAACYSSIRDKNYGLMVFTLPFWLVGIYLVRKKLLGRKSQNQEKSQFNFMVIISAGLVLIAFLAGLILLWLGMKQHDIVMIFAGGFFAFGSFTFVLAALTAMGHFDKVKVDVLGVYIGILFVVIGSGIIALKYRETFSFAATIQAFGLWIVIPVMLALVGVLQIVKCLKNRK